MRLIKMMFCLFMMLMLTACFQSQRTFYINPDASGKVVYDWKGPLPQDMGFGQGEAKDVEEQLKDAAVKIMDTSQGIDIWKDVSFKILNNGKMHFKGTAYFKNVANLKIGDKGGDFDMSLEKTKNGLSLVFDKEDKKKDDTNKGDKKNQDDKVKAKELLAKKVEYQRSFPMLNMMMSDMKSECTLNLPGKIISQKAFTKKSDTQCQFTFDGNAMLKFVKAQAEKGNFDFTDMKPKMGPSAQKDQSLNAFLEMMGMLDTGRIDMEAGKALFDYKKEVAEARQNYKAMMKKLKLTGASAPIADTKGVDGDTKGHDNHDKDKGTGLSNLRVAGLSYISYADAKNDLRPFYKEKGVSLVIVGDFKGEVLSLDEVKFDKVVTMQDEDLLKSSEWARKASFPKVSKDKKKGLFEVNLNLPKNGLKAFKEIAGTVKYSVASTTKLVDLGMMDLKKDVKGKALGAKIVKAGKSDWGDGNSIELSLKVSRAEVRAITVYDANGKKLDFSQGGSSWGGQSYTVTLRTNKALPAKAKIVVDMYADLKTYTKPFKLTNVEALGEGDE